MARTLVGSDVANLRTQNEAKETAPAPAPARASADSVASAYCTCTCRAEHKKNNSKAVFPKLGVNYPFGVI